MKGSRRSSQPHATAPTTTSRFTFENRPESNEEEGSLLNRCPIWDTPASVEAKGDRQIIRSARTDGEYVLTGSAVGVLGGCSGEIKARLKAWLVDRRRAGEARPVVNLEVLKLARDAKSASVAARKERLLRSIHSIRPPLTFRFRLGGHVNDALKEWIGKLAAWSESKDPEGDDVRGLCQLLKEDHLLREENGEWRLTTRGWDYLDSLNSRGGVTLQVFVAMWFSQQMEDAYENGIVPAIKEAGYEPLRIDRKEHNNKIDDEIIAEIKSSKFLVADFTSGTTGHGNDGVHVPRGGVYYEAGFARGLGLDVISTVRSDQVGLVHFDTRQISHVLWKDPPELRKALFNRIIATIGYAPSSTSGT